MAIFRVLAMDGTSMRGGAGWFTMALLQILREKLGRPFLDRVGLFAGTSAGAFNALFFAKESDPDAALPRGIDYWEKIVESMTGGNSVFVPRALAALAGQTAMMSPRGLRRFFLEYFRDPKTKALLKLRDLRHKVAIPSYQLYTETSRNMVGAHRWKDKVFNNIGKDGEDPDFDELVLDVALRSSSPPILTPMYQSLDNRGPCYVDGGVFANNPSMCAVAQILAEEEKDPTALPFTKLTDLRLLSVGTGDSTTFLAPATQDGMADWGYSQWMLDLRHPGLAIEMMLDSGMDATHYICEKLLNRGLRHAPSVPGSSQFGKHYCRIQPILQAPLMITTAEQVREITQTIKEAVRNPRDKFQEHLAAQVQHTVEWISTCGWFSDEAGAGKERKGRSKSPRNRSAARRRKGRS